MINVESRDSANEPMNFQAIIRLSSRSCVAGPCGYYATETKTRSGSAWLS